jgi:hypothetical protein
MQVRGNRFGCKDLVIFVERGRRRGLGGGVKGFTKNDRQIPTDLLRFAR